MSANYSPWKINLKDFEKIEDQEEKIKFLLKFAVLAPSGHNAQPWKVKLTKNNVEIKFDDARGLPVGDPSRRLGYIGIGCFIENFLIAADYFGYKTNLTLSEKDSNPIQISLKFAKSNKSLKHLIKFITSRVTNRSEYEEKLPNNHFLKEIENLSNNSLEVGYLINTYQQIALCEDAVNANIQTFEDKSFREELSRHVRHNLTKQKTGMPAFGMGMSTPVSFLVPSLIKLMNVNKMSKNKDLNLLIKHTPAFGLISTKTNTRFDWINVGRVFERVCLTAASHDIAIGPMAGPMIIEEYSRRMKGYFGTKLLPQMFFRIGYPTKITKHSPRLSVEEILE